MGKGECKLGNVIRVEVARMNIVVLFKFVHALNRALVRGWLLFESWAPQKSRHKHRRTLNTKQ